MPKITLATAATMNTTPLSVAGTWETVANATEQNSTGARTASASAAMLGLDEGAGTSGGSVTTARSMTWGVHGLFRQSSVSHR
jgi:hypothetical protein